jgi:STAS domain
LSLMLDRQETCWVFRVEGDFNMTASAELKALLLEGLAAGKELHLDLERAAEIDITLLQLAVAAEREAARVGSLFITRVSETAAGMARDAGLPSFPGTAEAHQG